MLRKKDRIFAPFNTRPRMGVLPDPGLTVSPADFVRISIFTPVWGCYAVIWAFTGHCYFNTHPRMGVLLDTTQGYWQEISRLTPVWGCYKRFFLKSRQDGTSKNSGKTQPQSKLSYN